MSPTRLRACYEAGPTGYELYRLLGSMGVDCEVIAPSLVPVAPGDKVKTDRRDARRLVRLFRAGELVTVRVPTREEEGCRDLSRLRGAAMVDRRRARQRLGSFLLRHHLVYRDGRAWTLKHRRWLRSLSFDDAGTRATFAHLLASVEERERRVDRDRQLISRGSSTRVSSSTRSRVWAPIEASRRSARSGWRVRCATGDGSPPPRSSWASLVSSPASTRPGRACALRDHQIRQRACAAHPRRSRVGVSVSGPGQPRTGTPPPRRPTEVIARAWNAQVRLCGRFRRLAARKDRRTVVATAVARELAGFVWAEMTA